MRAVVVLLCFISWTAVAQDWAKVPEQSKVEAAYRVGDRVPELELHNMINYPAKTYKLADHKAKLTLLDFWDTNCGPCIKFWPTALALQKEFGADLQIIPVNNYQGSKTVKAFLAKRKRIDGVDMTLPMSCRDSTIWRKFPGWSLPRYVWIDGSGVIGAITAGKDVTRENIKKWIDKGPFKMDNLSEKKYYPVIYNQPIYVNGNGGEKPSDVFLWTSSLTKGQDDNPSSPWIFYDSLERYGICNTNVGIIHLYGSAYNNRMRDADSFDFFDYLPISRMELIAKDTSKYYDDGSLGGNTFNYQLLSGKRKSKTELQDMMKQDLDRYFGLNVKWEKRSKKCLVISMFDSTLAKKKKSLGAEMKMRDHKIIVDSATVRDMIALMEIGTWNYRNWKYPIVDETKYKGRILGLREDGDGENPAVFDSVLKKYGLRLKFEMREVDVLVLREPK